MNRSPDQPTNAPRDAAYWAERIDTLKVANVPDGALNLNVDGRRAVGPMQGFGKMWQKTYRVQIGTHVSPAEVIGVWKKHFPEFWPPGNRFCAPLEGIAPGDVVLINGAVPGGLVSTGIMVIYADDKSFTFMTPEGHPFSGWVTFSAYREDDCTVAQSQVLIRANDPLYELAMPLGLSHAEDEIWRHTLAALAAHFDVQGRVEIITLCVDRRRQWSRAKNIWYNAGIRSMVYGITAPLRRVRGPARS
jgi:hypothetical protein